jgi:hypothetical protein
MQVNEFDNQENSFAGRQAQEVYRLKNSSA